MEIAIIGVKGIPVVYSGFETFVEEFSTRLVKDKKFKVTVYCRSPYVDKNRKKYKDVRLVALSVIKRKNLETILHSFISTIHACIFGKYDIIYYVGVGNAIFTIFPRLIGIKTIINVDGFDWRREKWGSLAKSYLKLSSYMAMYFPNAVVTDSLVIKRYYSQKHKKQYYYIPYGYMDKFNDKNSQKILKKYALLKNKYFVWVGRIVPENHPEDLLLAFSRLKTDFKCVLIGDNFYKDKYTDEILSYGVKNPNVIFTGFLDREEYAVLVKNAYAYMETKRSGGTHPSLLEAMGFDNLIISNNNPANKELLKSNAFYYNTDLDLLRKLEYIINPNFKNGLKYRKAVKSTVEKFFNWEKIIGEYKILLLSFGNK